MNEKRLIDANALSDLLDVEYRRKMNLVRKGEKHLDTLAEGIMSTSILLGTMPTVDAVEVVRCKDCKYYDACELTCELLFNPCATNVAWYPEDYCSYGERKDNA